MSTLEDHDDEQAAITAVWDAPARALTEKHALLERARRLLPASVSLGGAVAPKRVARCVKCGSDDIYIDDISAYWNEDAQEWQLSDFSTAQARCGECEHCHNDCNDTLVEPLNIFTFTGVFIEQANECGPTYPKPLIYTVEIAREPKSGNHAHDPDFETAMCDAAEAARAEDTGARSRLKLLWASPGDTPIAYDARD